MSCRPLPAEPALRGDHHGQPALRRQPVEPKLLRYTEQAGGRSGRRSLGGEGGLGGGQRRRFRRRSKGGGGPRYFQFRYSFVGLEPDLHWRENIKFKVTIQGDSSGHALDFVDLEPC